MFKRAAAVAALALGTLALAGLVSPPAQARVFVGVGIGVPWYYPPPYYPYYAPPAVVYAPPPVVYAQPTYVAPPASGPAPTAAQYWYYCDNPQGYYPYVAQCNSAWRPVAPTPPTGH